MSDSKLNVHIVSSGITWRTLPALEVALMTLLLAVGRQYERRAKDSGGAISGGHGTQG